MKKLKPHFDFNKKQRNGVFAFVVLLVTVQLCGNFWIENSIEPKVFEIDFALQQKIDSLKKAKIAMPVKKINPNYLNDSQGYFLGMTIHEIDKLLVYRASNNWVNSFDEFQEITGVSDSLLGQLKTKFYFPKKRAYRPVEKTVQKKHFKTYDLNKATVSELVQIKGIGPVLAKRIVAYRNKLSGYTYQEQLDEVYGLSGEVLLQVKKYFKIFTKPTIQKININTASFKEVLSIAYIDYETTQLLFQYRKKVVVIEDISEIKKIAGFPIENYDRITLYLHAE